MVEILPVATDSKRVRRLGAWGRGLRAGSPTERRVGSLKEFVELPYSVYAADPHWVPPLRRDEYRRFDTDHNPFLAHASLSAWVARSRAGGRVEGRIAFIEDRRFNEVHEERTGWFGFFEARSVEVALALLAHAEAAARARNLNVLRGPVNPTLNESAGLLVEGFDADPCVLMPYNPPAYGTFLERAGYGKAKDLLAWTIDLTKPIGERIARVARRVAERHRITIRPVDLRHFNRELAALQSIYSAAWSNNWGFVAPTPAELEQLATDLRPILDPDIALFAEQRGNPVGCVIAIPDVNQVLKRMKGRLFPFGIVHYLRRTRIIDAGRVILLGVHPDHRRMGLYPLLIAEVARRGQERGYVRGELSWTLEDNHDINAGIQAAGGMHHKTYRVYEKEI
jgi:GNAT superfamily N-acetyltransferase